MCFAARARAMRCRRLAIAEQHLLQTQPQTSTN
jgi:hypothetical protein